MSQTVDVNADSIVDEGSGDLFADLSPQVLLYDESSLADAVADELSQLSWDHLSVDTETEALRHVEKDEIDCLVVAPRSLDKPVEFVRDVRDHSDVPVIVWGNSIQGDDVRLIADIQNATYVPKPDARGEKVFCMTSMNEPPQAGPIETSSPSQSGRGDDVVVSIINHAVRSYLLGEKVETQLDAIEQSINGIGILDEDYEFLYTNEKLADVFGYDSPDILVGNCVQMCFPHYEIEHFQNDILECDCVEEGWRGNVDCRRMDGTTFPARISVSSVGADKYLFTVDDISEQESLQEELDEFHEHIGQAFVAIREDYRISHLNQTARAFFDLPDVDQVRGESFFENVDDKLEATLRDELLEVDSTGEGTSFSLHSDSYDSWLEIRIYPFDRGYAIYFKDITERKEQQRQLDLAKQFINQSEDAYLVIEAESGKLVDVNQTAHKWFGTSKSELVGENIVDVINKFSDIDDYTMEDHRRFCEEARGEGVAVHKAAYGPPSESLYPIEAHGTCEEVNGDEYLIVAGTNRKKGERTTENEGLSTDRSILDSYPDPTILLDANTSEIIDVNYRALEITGYSYEDLVNSEYSYLFPESIADSQTEQLESVIEQGGGRYRRSEDGSYIFITTKDDNTIPVELSTSTVDAADGPAHLVVLRSIEKSAQYEQSFRQINEMICDLVKENNLNTIAEMAVDRVENMPHFHRSCLFLYDDDEGVLELSASTACSDCVLGDSACLAPGDNKLWEIYNEGETRIVDSENAMMECAGTHGEIAVPVGTHGVLFITRSEFAVRDETVVDIADFVGSSIESGFDRVKSIRELRERQRQADLQKQQLEYVSDLNDKIRSLNKSLVQADSEDAIKEAVCDGLYGLDGFDGVMFCDIDTSSECPEPAQSTGISNEFIDRLASLESHSAPPTIQAAKNGEMAKVSNIPTTAKEEDWASIALEHEYKSAISVPLEHGDISYGILSIYSEMSESFKGRTEEVLKELGSLIAYAFNAVASRAALGSESGIDLTLTLGGGSGLSDLAASLGATITVQNITPATDDDYYLVHGHIEDTDHEDVVEAVDDIGTFDDLRLIGEEASGIYELKIEEVGDIIKIVGLGASLRSAVVTPTDTDVTVTLSPDRDQSQFIEQVKDTLPTAQLRATQAEIDTNTIPWTQMLRDPLTDKQEEALRTAYHAGYFESPADTTGRELAESMGLTQGTISYRIRAAQRNLYETLWDSKAEHKLTTNKSTSD
jgi:PAS domain S-box-containing protein